MKKHIYYTGLLLLLSFVIGSCTEEEKPEGTPTVPVQKDQEEEPYTSHYYYSFEAVRQLSATDFGLKDGKFTPGPAYLKGDTLFVANIQSETLSLELYDRTNNRHLTSLKSWKYKEAEQKFPEKIEAIAASGNRIYLANKSSQIDVFDINTLEFITRIGDGNWGETKNQMMHSHAMVITPDGNIIVRTKKNLLVYQEVDVTPENYQKVPFYCRSNGDGMDANNKFRSHQMVQDSTGIIYLADFGQFGNKKIQAIDTALIQKGDKITLIDTEKTLALDFNPCGIALYEDKMIVSAQNGSLSLYDRTKESWGSSFKSVKGFTFKKPEKLLTDKNSFWISDQNANVLVEVRIYKNEIREYD
ncbi:hypothetical protein [uncultured Bacteroides sp.]|mgnify:CR=1 FL=1|uniref:hypothetical protein n=1 Tax=uncultured Bacteroides sp. TaxID=162156 RepID=UPI0025FD67DD|nr:hypothetical protein [uncultured Bacteroides sp.]